MQITRFEVDGYKNLTAPIVLDELGPVNVLHGNNDVGKSNLLESMELAFRLLSAKGSLPVGNRTRTFSAEEFLDLTGRPLRYAFNAFSPKPIRICVHLSIAKDEFIRANLASTAFASHVVLEQTLTSDLDGGVKWKISLFNVGNAPVNEGDAQPFILFLGRQQIVGKTSLTRFQLIPANRVPLASESLGDDHRGLVPPSLALDLYDAKESAEAIFRERWDLFRDIVAQQINLSPEAISAIYDRATGKASVIIEHRNGGRMILPLEFMGSGTQQIAGLIGQMLLSGATILAVEEPEINLRYARQLGLRDALQLLTKDPRGPSQLFLSSHSPAFELSPYFYAMEAHPGGPQVVRRPVDLLTPFLGCAGPEPPPAGAKGVQSYVSGDGLLKLPAPIVEQLRLQGGGGVVVTALGERSAEIMPNETFVQRYGLDDNR